MSKNYTNIQKLDNITGSIDDNSDVNLLGLADGQFLRYSVSSGAWLPSSSGDFSSLSINGTGISISGHAHIVDDITNFSETVSGLLTVTNLEAGSGIDVINNNGEFTISVTGTFGLTGEQVDTRVGNLLQAGSYIDLNYQEELNTLTISATGLQPTGNYSVVGHNHSISDIQNLQTELNNKQPTGDYSIVGHTHTSSSITDFNSSVSGLVDSIYAPITGTLNQFGITSSSQLASVINDETGTGLLVFNTSPLFTGTPLVPTAPSGTNNNQIASTSFVRTEISNLVNSAPETLDTLQELATALGNDANFSATVTSGLANKANLSGANFTGPISSPSGNFTVLSVNNSFVFPTIDGFADQVLQTDGAGNVVWADINAGNLIEGTGSLGYVTKWVGNNIISTGIIYDNGSRVGIGTIAPTTTLHVQSSAQTSAQIQSLSSSASLDIKHNNSGLYGYIGFNNNNNKYSFIQHNGSATTSYGGANALSIYNYAGPVILGASSSNTYEQNVVVNTDGNVGIGTVSPSAKLDVSGVIKASGGNSSNWNTAYGWGNHAIVGYQSAITGAASTITSNNLTASRVLMSNDSGKVVISDITSTELSYLDNASSNIQTQINNKVSSNSTITGATKTKIAYDSKGLVTAGADLIESDIPTLSQNKITNLTTDLSDRTTKTYIASRGQNLLTNGTALLGDNTNFSSFVFDGSQANSSPGSFRFIGPGTIYTDEFMPVLAEKRYKMTADAKSLNGLGRYFMMTVAYDVDNQAISAQHHMYRANTLTTLAAPLNNGDTVLYLTSAANWDNSGTAGVNTYLRSIILWNYTNSFGYQYPPSTYSRNWTTNAWDPGSINFVNNTITLRVPWAGGTVPSGTYLSNGSSGSSFKYNVLSNTLLNTTWTTYTGVMEGVDYSGTNVQTKFPPGTAKIKMGWLMNYLGTGETAWFTNMVVTLDDLAYSSIYDNGTNIGIGTSSPASKLHIVGDTTIEGSMRWDYPGKPLDSSVGVLGYLRLYDETGAYAGLGVSSSSFNIGASGAINFRTLTNGVERLYIDTAGNVTFNESGLNSDFRVEGDTDQNLLFVDASADDVGIGTNTPLDKLTIQPANATTDLIGMSLLRNSSWGSSYQNKYLSYTWRDNANVVAAIGARYDGNTVNIDFHSLYNNAHKTSADVVMSIHGDGNVGIGTIIPSANLHVSGGVKFDSFMRVPNIGQIMPGTVSGFIITDGDYLGYTNSLTDYLGDIGIGTGVPTARLNVEGGNVVFNDLGNNYNFRVEGDNDANLLFVQASGDRIGIGTSSPASKLHVNGEIRASGNLVPATDNTGAVGTAALTWNNGQFTNLTVDSTLTVTSTLNVRAAIDLADNDILRFGDADDWEMYHNGVGNFIDLTVGDLIIRDDATAGDPVRMVIQRAGNVGIGTNSPTSILTVDSGNVVFNESGGNFDFRVEGDTDENLVSVDASSDRVGIGILVPQAKLDVRGSLYANDVVTLGSGSIPLPRRPIELLNHTNIDQLSIKLRTTAQGNWVSGYTFPTADGTSGQTLVTNGSGVVSWSSAGSNNLTRGSFDLTQSTGTFNVDGGYNVGTLDVYYNGIKLLSGTDYTATNGTSFTLTNVATSGDVVEYVALNASTSAVGNTTLGSVTATNSQSVFNVTNGYTAGGLAVFLNGVKLIDGTDFTATNGTSFTLTSPASSGDIVDYIAYGAVVASSNLQKTGDTMTGNLTIGNGSDLIVEGDLIVAKYKEGFVNGGNSSTSKTIDITSGTLQTVTLTDNCTFTMPSVEAGRSFTLLLKTGTGSFTSTFTGVKWPNDSAPTITTTASKLDILTFVSDGTNWYGNISQNYSV